VTETAASTRPENEISPLELFHPEGVARHSAVEGDGQAGVALPPSAAAGAAIDLFVIAPTPEQARARGWFEHVLEAMTPRLNVDGVTYVIARRFRRRRVSRLLAERGFRSVVVVAHVPSLERTRYLVPLDGVGARRAFETVVAVWPHRRRLAQVLLRLPNGPRVLGAVLGSSALVAQRSGGPPLFDWVSRLCGAPFHPSVVMTTGRDDRGLVLASESLVVKVRDERSQVLEREAANLVRIGSAARAGGASVPELRSIRSAGARTVLVETALPGTPVAGLLGFRPRARRRVLALLADWLQTWQRATVVLRAPARNELERLLLDPAELIAADLEGGRLYLSWLAERCRRIEGPLPFVAAHNDLTMFNVLLDGDRIGVVDWEAASEAQFPLSDLAYAAVDAVAAASRYKDERVDAFRKCFCSNGADGRLVTTLRERLTSSLRIAPEIAELSLHACWVQHAANERRRAGVESARPFLAIVERLASDFAARSQSRT